VASISEPVSAILRGGIRRGSRVSVRSGRALRALDRIVLRAVERASRLGEGVTVSEVYFKIVERHPNVEYWDVLESFERLLKAGLVKVGEPKEVRFHAEEQG
jgi:hypothetical protein